MILAVNGYHSLFDYQRALPPNGTYVVIGGAMPQLVQGVLFGPLRSRMGRRQMFFWGIAKPNQNDLMLLAELLAAGKVVPVIDRTYPLSEVAEAIKYVIASHARGKVIIKGIHSAP